MKIILKIIMGWAVMAITAKMSAQTNLQFTSVKVTPEKAIQLYWTSTNHELYQIQYANALATNADGSTAWQTLYDQYPSQGANTMIGDFGNYDVTVQIPHPKNSAMRFYRIVDEGADNDSVDTPSVVITSPTNGDVLSGTVTVSVIATCSNLPVVTTKLYVDGQEMNPSDDGTNYTINTCEWWNGSHTIYAVAAARSSLTGPDGNYPVSTSHGVSPYLPVTFSNLISEIAFSQPFFQPSLGQTQEVTATFAANCDWTLQVIDDSSNVVRNAAGSGNSMVFDWDGTGDGETNIPDGVYYYYISATTNGEPDEIVGGGSTGGGGSPPTPAFAPAASPDSESSELWAMPTNGSGSAVPFSIYPPGMDTNDLTIFSASQSEIRSADLSFARTASLSAPAFYPGAAGQGGIAPNRPPTSANKNSLGDIGVAFFAHLSTNTYAVPQNGYGLPGNGGKVQLEGSYGNATFDPIPEAGDAANDFVKTMRKKGWWGANSFNLSGSSLRMNNLRRASLGGNEIFGNVNVGLFMDHGDYGTSLDVHSDANFSYQTYFSTDNPADASAPWLRLSEFGMGGNLRFMAILACNVLRDQNYNSMVNQGVLPIKSNLHLLCSTSTYSACGDVGGVWAQNMTGSFFHSAQTVVNAWYNAGSYVYGNADMSNWTYGVIIFRVAGQDNCFGDMLNNYQSSTSGNITHQDKQVYP